MAMMPLAVMTVVAATVVAVMSPRFLAHATSLVVNDDALRALHAQYRRAGVIRFDALSFTVFDDTLVADGASGRSTGIVALDALGLAVLHDAVATDRAGRSCTRVVVFDASARAG
jgi:hypothetical protein